MSFADVFSVGMLWVLLPAFVACLVLTGIHVYLGLHVLARGVIFVDLALAQVAALGTTAALLFDIEPGSALSYFVSLGFTFAGAGLFTLARSQSTRVPVEAFIGIVYAVASAVAVIIADRLPHGAEQIHEILVGNLLSVSWPHIFVTMGTYAAVGVVHLVLRDKFFTVSLDPEKAAQQGMRIWLWDLLFYLTFGVVITSSVAMGGVLVVFSFLVIPTVIVALFVKGTLARLLLGWGVGVLGSIVGITASAVADPPPAAAVVVTFGVFLAVAFVVRMLLPGKVPELFATHEPPPSRKVVPPPS